MGPAFPLRGGIAAHNEMLSHHLIQKGHPSSIVSYSMQYPDFLFPGKTQFQTNEATSIQAKLDIQKKVNSINPLSWIQTANYINQLAPSFVVLRFWMPYFGMALGTIARRINKKKTTVIGLADNIIPHEKKPGDHILTRYYLNGLDGLMTMSTSVEADALSFNQELKSIYAPHPIYDQFGESVSKEEACKKLNLDPSCNYLLFFGLVRKYKGLDLLLQSMGTEEFQRSNIKLLIAGEYYDDETEYQQLIHQFGLQDLVISKNAYIPDEDVKYYFSAADLVTQTYHTATQSGISQIAYHFEKPMLVTNVGGLPEIVPHLKVGYVCNKDPQEIAESINDFFLNNREETFKTHLIKEKEKYSWDYFVKKLVEIYHQCNE